MRSVSRKKLPMPAIDNADTLWITVTARLGLERKVWNFKNISGVMNDPMLYICIYACVHACMYVCMYMYVCLRLQQ